MSKEIDCKQKAIYEIFSNFWFCIPKYQRQYVWQDDQVIALLDDIYDRCQQDPDSPYFLGSMVLRTVYKTNDGSVPYTEYELLDGQQRITTLFLIFAVLRDILQSDRYVEIIKDNNITIDEETFKSRIENCKKAVFTMKNPDAGKPERIRIRVDNRQDVQDFIEKYVKGDNKTTAEFLPDKTFIKTGDSISKQNMIGAILTIRSFLWEKAAELSKFVPYLMRNVKLVYVATEELEDAFNLFTVLNQRGLKLSNGDILKAQNLGDIKDKNKENIYATKWEEMEDYFGEQFDGFLGLIRMILSKKKQDQNLLKEFEIIFQNRKCQKGEAFFDLVYDYYGIYKTIFEHDGVIAAECSSNSDYSLINRIYMMEKGLKLDYWKAPLMLYYKKFNTLNMKEFVRRVDNKISSDWILSLTPTVRIGNVIKILEMIDSSADPKTILSAIDCFRIDIKAFRSILENDVYGKAFANYLMLKADMLRHSIGTSLNLLAETISIEHILPQTISAGSQWEKDFDDKARQSWLHKIGNLILISRRKNTSLGNLNYNDKKSKYFKNNIETFASSLYVFETFKTWTPADVKRHQDEVIDIMLKDYSA